LILLNLNSTRVFELKSLLAALFANYLIVVLIVIGLVKSCSIYRSLIQHENPCVGLQWNFKVLFVQFKTEISVYLSLLQHTIRSLSVIPSISTVSVTAPVWSHTGTEQSKGLHHIFIDNLQGPSRSTRSLQCWNVMETEGDWVQLL